MASGCTFEPFLFDYFDTLIGRTTPNCWCHMLLNDHSTRFPGFPQTNRTLQSKYIQILKICVWQPAYTWGFLPPSSTASSKASPPIDRFKAAPRACHITVVPASPWDDRSLRRKVLLHVCCRGISFSLLICYIKMIRKKRDLPWKWALFGCQWLLFFKTTVI